MTEVLLCAAAEMSDARLIAIRLMLDEAFEGHFGDDDWEHGLGGTHAMILEAEQVLAHASIVARRITVGSLDVRVGYVEGVGVTSSRQREGLGSAVMRALGEVVRDQFELGMLSTGEWEFYERLGWERWHGETWTVHSDGRRERTAEEDDGIMAFRTKHSTGIDTSSGITCEHRAGDSW